MSRLTTRAAVLAAAAAFLAAPAAHAYVTYSTYAQNLEYTTTLQTISTYEYAVSFVPTKTVTLSSFTIPLTVIGQSAPHSVTLSLRANTASNTPGDSLYSSTINNIIDYSQNNNNGANYTVVPTADNITLTAGTTYWLRATPAPGSTTGWFVNPVNKRDNYLWTNDNGATWAKFTPQNLSGAMQITGFLPGDITGDDRVNADDFARIDRGLAAHLTGRTNGDLNGDGAIDSLDYHIIDAAFLAQNPTAPADLLSQRESQFGADYVAELLASVPEPTSLFAACGLALPAFARRRRD